MTRLMVLTAAALAALAAAAAAQHMHPASAGDAPAMSSADGRELLRFPPMMQTHLLHNMRNHMEALDAILSAIDAGDYAKASQIARDRLGLDSPAAESCKPKGADVKPAAPDSMDAMMAVYMPAAMRALGLSLHASASRFADVAARAQATHDTAAVLKGLSEITPNCVACHAAYRLR